MQRYRPSIRNKLRTADELVLCLAAYAQTKLREALCRSTLAVSWHICYGPVYFAFFTLNSRSFAQWTDAREACAQLLAVGVRILC